MRVALLTTCLADALFPAVAQATVQVLRRIGIGVEVPGGQTCCGQMHVNSGYAGLAVPVIEHFGEVFDGYDAIVTPSGSCAGAVRHQHAPLAARAGEQARARAASVASRTYELSELLVDVLGVTDVGARYPHRVTYHPTCHSMRMLRLGDKPLQLLRNVRDLELVELPQADSCCGFGGTFSVKNPAVSGAMLSDKASCVISTGAEACAAVDASCLMHIGGGLARTTSSVRAVHLAEILAST